MVGDKKKWEDGNELGGLSTNQLHRGIATDNTRTYCHLEYRLNRPNRLHHGGLTIGMRNTTLKLQSSTMTNREWSDPWRQNRQPYSALV